MPTDEPLGGHALVAKFDDKDAAHIACSMLRDVGINCEEEVKYSVIVSNVTPEQHDRAKILLENAGASAMAEDKHHSKLMLISTTRLQAQGEKSGETPP